MSQELVNYSQQINEAHTACLAAKELGGKKAHECGTWLLKQKEAVPHGAWLPWVKQHCEFNPRAAQNYMAIAGLEIRTAMRFSIQDALWEVAQQKAEEAEIDEEIAADRARGSASQKMDEFVEHLRQQHEYRKSLSPEERAAYERACEEKEEAELKTLQGLKEVALEIVKAGFRELAKKHHPDQGGDPESMRALTDAKQEVTKLITTKWRKS